MEKNVLKVPESEFRRRVGSDMPAMKPLESLPERTWLKARIEEVSYQYVYFNGQLQYLTDQTQQQILDEQGNPIPRKEFEINFSFLDYKFTDGSPRKSLPLRMGASFGEKANLPKFLANVIPDVNVETPDDIIAALRGKLVKVQLVNKPNKKDPKKPPYQVVIYDAVKQLEADTPPKPEAPTMGLNISENGVSKIGDEIPF